MAVTHPELAAEFHPTKNGTRSPETLLATTSKKIWWQCSQNPEHVWRTNGDNRVYGRTGCPLCASSWTIARVRDFVHSLIQSGAIEYLEPHELWLLFQQNGAIREAATRRREFINALATGRIDTLELERFSAGEASAIDRLIDGSVDSEEFLDQPTAYTEELVLDNPEPVAENLELPNTSVRDTLAVLESDIWASADEEAVEFLIASAVRKMWRVAYDEKHLEKVLAETKDVRSNVTSERSRKQFRDELDLALAMKIPKDYKFTINGKRIDPNLMQRHFATQAVVRKRVGNWSGTGAGKTLSAVLASRLLGARLTLVCCPNSTIERWCSTISNAFPTASVVTKTLKPIWPKGSSPRYLILNYELFQQENSEADAALFLETNQPDVVVIDEIHYAKQRTDTASKRRKVLEGLLSQAAQKNTDSPVAVLGLSATPVINNLREGISMIELVSGVEHSDLDEQTNVANAMKVYQKLTTLGQRWMPPYPNYGEHNPRINMSHYRDDILFAMRHGTRLELEQILLIGKLPAIVEHLNRDGGTVIYTEYVNGMANEIGKAVTDAGFSVGYYTGLDKSGLQQFKDRKIDVLIGSSAIGTGVDGLQHVASKLIVACAPWTSAGYEQLVGRLVRTSQEKQVDVVFPLTYLETPNGDWSYDEGMRLNRIRYKKTIADCAVDGVVPEAALRTPAQAFQDALAWLERLDGGVVEEVLRRPISVPLPNQGVEVIRREARYGDFSTLNKRWNGSKSTTTHERLRHNPEEWKTYHTLYGKARKTWTWVPYRELAKIIGRGSMRRVIADLGCGEDLLGQALREKGMLVHSFDHIAISKDVTAIDIGEGIPLGDGEVDVAIFCLSLMGKNNGDYIPEAARVLAFDGDIHIVEASSRIKDLQKVIDRLERLGFGAVTTNQLGDPSFTYIKAKRSDLTPELGLNLTGPVREHS